MVAAELVLVLVVLVDMVVAGVMAARREWYQVIKVIPLSAGMVTPVPKGDPANLGAQWALVM